VKSRRSPGAPLTSHTLQLGAYCLLVEDHFDARPAHGLIRYADATFQVPFTEELRRAVLEAAAEIRIARTASDVPRQHDDPARCRACGYRQACGTDALG
jgi:CRISPR-associated exonuclease Cas4